MTDLPLRPDGGIDLDKCYPEWKDHAGRITSIRLAKKAVTATLERVAKWHEGQAVIYQERCDDYPRPSLPAAHNRGYAQEHKHSAAAIRAMKP